MKPHRRPPTPPISWWAYEEAKLSAHEREKAMRAEKEREAARRDPRQVDWVAQFNQEFGERRQT